MKFFLSLLSQTALVTWLVGTLTFIITRTLPGDMAYRIAAGRYGHDLVDTAAALIVQRELNLDQSAIASYLDWIIDLIKWDLGVSLVSGAKITTLLLHEFGNTFTLALSALAISILLGPPLGALLVMSKSKSADKLSLAVAVLTRSVPTYVIGILLIVLFSVYLQWFPAAGYGKGIHYVLPALTLALPLTAVSIRITSSSLATVMNSAYWEFSRLKGLRKMQTFVHHGLRNMAIPIIAFHGVQLIYLIEGVVIVETLFAWPGIGHSMVHAVVARDIPMIQGTAMTFALSFVLLNALLDIIYRLVDPKEKKQ